MTTDNFCFYLQNRLIQTSQTGGQWYSDTSWVWVPLQALVQKIREKDTMQMSDPSVKVVDRDKRFSQVVQNFKVARAKFSTLS